MNLPSGDQLLGTDNPLAATRSPSGPAPVASFRYIPTSILLYAINRPSGDQMGFIFAGTPNVSCVAIPLAKSSTHVSPPRSLATRFPSGETMATAPASG